MNWNFLMFCTIQNCLEIHTRHILVGKRGATLTFWNNWRNSQESNASSLRSPHLCNQFLNTVDQSSLELTLRTPSVEQDPKPNRSHAPHRLWRQVYLLLLREAGRLQKPTVPKMSRLDAELSQSAAPPPSQNTGQVKFSHNAQMLNNFRIQIVHSSCHSSLKQNKQ